MSDQNRCSRCLGDPCHCSDELEHFQKIEKPSPSQTSDPKAGQDNGSSPRAGIRWSFIIFWSAYLIFLIFAVIFFIRSCSK